MHGTALPGIQSEKCHQNIQSHLFGLLHTYRQAQNSSEDHHFRCGKPHFHSSFGLVLVIQEVLLVGLRFKDGEGFRVTLQCSYL